MTPEILQAYLTVFKRNNCMSAAFKLDGMEFAVTFGPDMPADDPGFGEYPTPGGWKAETGTLDAPFVDDEAGVPE